MYNLQHQIIMNVDQDLFSAYAFYAGVVTLKMLVMSLLTIRTRITNRVFMSSEDIKGYYEKEYEVCAAIAGGFQETLCSVRPDKV